LLDLLHQLLGAVRGLQRIGTRHLVEGDEGSRLAVEPALLAIVLGAKFDAGNIADAHDRAVWVGAQHDAAELLGALQATLRAHRVGELLAPRNRLGTNRSGRIDGVLRIDGVDDLRDRDVQLGQLVGLDPQPHRILAGTEDGDAGDSLDPRHLVIDIDIGIVGEEDVVVGAVRRVEREHDQRRRGRLGDSDAVVAHVRRQLRLGLAFAHLGEQLVGVGVGAQCEVDVQRGLAVIGIDRIHVVHVVDAGHLLLDRGGHRLFDGQRVGAGVGAADLNLWRNDVWELGGRQPGHGDQTDDGHQDRDDHGHDRPIDEEL